MSSVPLWWGSFGCNMVRILILPSGSVLLLMLATDFNLEMVENDCLRNSVLFEVLWRSPLCCPWRSPLCCPWRSALSPWGSCVFSPWRSSDWSWKEADSMLYALLVTGLLLDLDQCGLPLPFHPLDVLWDFLSPPLDCLDLHWVLKWFLLPHLWHFLPHAGHSLGGWDIPHLPHILPLLLALAYWPWPFLCLKVLILLIVVDITTPPLDLCHWKSSTVASCCLACCNNLSKVTVSLRACLQSYPLFNLKVFGHMKE